MTLGALTVSSKVSDAEADPRLEGSLSPGGTMAPSAEKRVQLIVGGRTYEIEIIETENDEDPRRVWANNVTHIIGSDGDRYQTPDDALRAGFDWALGHYREDPRA
jgi:hypothetical protein